MNFSTKDNVLQDIKRDGNPRQWQEKKDNSLLVMDSLIRIGYYNQSYRISNCGVWLKFLECSQGHYKKLIGASFCRFRFCPMCNWRRSLMLHGQILKILHEVQERRKNKIRYLFLTLTIQNITADNLSSSIDSLFLGFKDLFRYKEVNKNIVGWVRNLEVTYNEIDKTYHPHFHVLIGVTESYFKVSGEYISQSKWTDLWQKALKVDYKPIVNIKAVKAKSGEISEKAVAETAKYSVKDTDYIKKDKKIMDEVLITLLNSLKNRRLIGFGKMFRQVKKDLNLKDIESSSADLVGADEDSDCKCPICTSNLKEQLYKWDMNISNYRIADY